VNGDPGTPAETEGLTQSQYDFYQGIRTKLRSWLTQAGPGLKYADILLVAPDIFHVLCRLVADKRIPPIQKAKVAATLAYFITPIGVVPEALVGPIGYIDDVALAAYVLNGLLNSEQADIVREHWAGDKDILEVVRGVLEVADSAIGSGLWRRLKGVRWPIGRGPRP
jgi:uncharacterized membrane protein YkvA (DUF1232 family)